MHARGNGTTADDFGHWERRWVMVPIRHGWILLSPEGDFRKLLGDEIDTREAALLLGCAQRTVQAACDEGRYLVEGRDWRKIYGRGGRGVYRLRRDAVLRLGAII